MTLQILKCANENIEGEGTNNLTGCYMGNRWEFKDINKNG